jgi:hypothetical protein
MEEAMATMHQQLALRSGMQHVIGLGEFAIG